jgi:hypothetical protein
MEKFTITELSYAVIAMSGAISAILMTIWRSRCKTINCCWGGARCDRDVLKEETYKSPAPVVTNEDFIL